MNLNSFYNTKIYSERHLLLSILGLLILYICISPFIRPKTIHPKIFKVVVTEKYRIIERKHGDIIDLDYEYLFDPEQYREHFFFDFEYPKNNSQTMKRLLTSIHKGDTLVVSVDKTEFYSIQNYGTNFIKDDFFNRSLKVYSIKKGNRTLLNSLTVRNNEWRGIKNTFQGLIFLVIVILVLKRVSVVKN